MTPVDDARVREIVRALKKKGQRDAIIALDANYRPVPRSVSRQKVAALCWKWPSLCEREWQDGCAACTYYRLTPLGLAVRAHLLSETTS